MTDRSLHHSHVVLPGFWNLFHQWFIKRTISLNLGRGVSSTFTILFGASILSFSQKFRSHYRHFHKEWVYKIFQTDHCVCGLEMHCEYRRCVSCLQIQVITFNVNENSMLEVNPSGSGSPFLQN